MQFVCYQNGNFLPQTEVSLPINTLGFTRGYAAFELFRTYDGLPFLFKEHLARLKTSAHALLLEYPEHVEEVVQQLVAKNPYPNLIFRLYLSEDKRGKSHFLALCNQVPLPPQEHYEQGIPIITTSLARHFHSVKSTCYISAILALKEAAKQKAEDALFKNPSGHLLELTKSNFFAIQNGTLYTPKEEILLGITRNIVLVLAHKLSIPVHEGPIPHSSIPSLEEAFSTSTIREILPISSIDQYPIPLGPITQQLQQAFTALTKNFNFPFT